MKILVAVDTSDVSHEAARTARALFPAAEIIVFSVASFGSYVSAHPIKGTIVVGAPTQAATELVEVVAKEAVTKAQTVLGDDAETGIEFGDPGQAICERASAIPVDAIVVGRREKNLLSRFFDPSVSEYVIRHASCPVVVVREHHEKS